MSLFKAGLWGMRCACLAPRAAAVAANLPTARPLAQSKLNSAAVEALKEIVRRVGKLDKGADGAAYVVLKPQFARP